MNNKVNFLRGTSGEYAVAEKDSDTIYFTTDDGKLYIGDKEVSGSDIIIDDTLSDTSTNPVQGNVIKQAIDNKADKTVATTTTDGLMSADDKTKLDDADNTYALKSKYGDTTINVGRKDGTYAGICSTAEGQNTTASDACSHAEGSNTVARGVCSHAEGVSTVASDAYSHAEGDGTTASGVRSHAGGGSSVASGDSSFAHGKNVQALHDHEVALGQYNKSSSDTLFSVGDGDSDTARHNAFEITTTGGKLHDKDIVTDDMSLPANGGNADTVDGLHADDFVNATDNSQIQIPNNVDVPAWIYANGKRYQRYMTNGDNIGLINVPNNSIVHVWYWYDGLNILAREHSSGKYYICDMINGVFSDWKDVYTSGFKPYVTGTLSEQASDSPVTMSFTIFDFTPSKVICQFGNGNAFFANVVTNGFSLTIPAGTTTIHYIAFK